jgi:hypothetical protein
MAASCGASPTDDRRQTFDADIETFGPFLGLNFLL